ncbi:DUF427 domain-containing protein [Pukyongiella litopenaei]|uniref:DUF427 domain-containing protein n=1 Tax=Pukyongiella litopenaei TaxID=2605946 RepID=A0A2S0MV74_9RHOB|nr:DUF427 domain-containing protein [Pukyongiella litopenaei]AVO39621.1 DUF427 domain-containing protein [Pukyongiella litopenaei]
MAGNHIRIRRAPGKWVVRTGGAVLGESDAALELSEGDRPPVIYFPRGDIAMAFLDRSDTTTHCPQKGDAGFFTIVTRSGRIEDAAWSYDTPHEAVDRIAGHLAFRTGDAVTVERL